MPVILLSRTSRTGHFFRNLYINILVKSKPTDRRVQKTMKLLHEALISLVLEKNYEAITVQEILDRANVGRSTFYTYYRDKDELLLLAFDHLQEQLQAAQAAVPRGSGNSYERIIGFSQEMFNHAQAFRKVYTRLIRSQAGPIVRNRIQKIFEDLIQKEFREERARRRKTGSIFPEELLIQYLASTFITVLAWWAEEKDALPPEQMNAIFRSLVLPSLASYFG